MSGAVKGVALLPCPNPWCVSHADGAVPNGDDVWQYPSLAPQYRVQCHFCPVEGPTANTEAEAVTAWNTRTTPPARSYADGVADVVNLCRQWSEPGAKVLSSMSGLTDAEHAIAQRTAEGIAEAASGLLSQGEKA